jgi:hypothetical protein
VSKQPIVRLDRLIAVAWAKPYWKLQRIPGYSVVKDNRVRPQGPVATYERVRELRSETSGTRVFWQYRPRPGWLGAWRITFAGDDLNGIAPREALSIRKRCRFAWLVLVELALDFDPSSGIDRAFVRQHAVFGKSRRRTDRGGPQQLRYGTRKSGKLIRCYWKEEVQAFRVELELHSRLLNKGRKKRARERVYELFSDLTGVPSLVFPKHLRFVRVNWRSLNRHLRDRFGPRSEAILETARSKARFSLCAVSRFLRDSGVNNVHRFLIPIRLNKKIDQALTKWALDFSDYFNRM